MRYLLYIIINVTLKIALSLIIDSAIRIQALMSRHFQEMADDKYPPVKKTPLCHARESSNTHPHVKQYFLAPVEVPEILFVYATNTDRSDAPSSWH